MIKLIATDMDGTLLDKNGHLPEGFTEIFTASVREFIAGEAHIYDCFNAEKFLSYFIRF